MTMVISILLFLSYIGASTAIRLYFIKIIKDCLTTTIKCLRVSLMIIFNTFDKISAACFK